MCLPTDFPEERATPVIPVNPRELSIPVHDLDAAGKEVRFRLRAPWVRTLLAEGTDDVAAKHGSPPIEVATPNDGELEVRVSKSGTDVVVHGTLKADLTLPCARCLEPAAVRIEQPVTVLMVPRSAMKAGGHGDEERELTEEEADVLPYDGDVVVLDDLVRDELLLAIPMIPLCSEDCAGIRPIPGAQPAEAALETETAIDPRLRPLLRLKKQLQ